jgi:hypothetical protein
MQITTLGSSRLLILLPLGFLLLDVAILGKRKPVATLASSLVTSEALATHALFLVLET